MTDSPRLKKKKKWGVVLPLIILFKLMKLQMMVMKVMMGIGIIQLLLVVGGVSLYYYLKYNTLCKVQPHLVHTHSHLEHAEPGYTKINNSFLYYIFYQYLIFFCRNTIFIHFESSICWKRFSKL